MNLMGYFWGGDGLDGVHALCEIEDVFRVEIPGHFDEMTFGRLVDHIHGKIKSGDLLPEPPKGWRRRKGCLMFLAVAAFLCALWRFVL